MSIIPQTFPARSRAQIVLSDIWVTRGANPVLKGVDLVVAPTSPITVVGENGRGNSTLLHVPSGQLNPDSGQVTRIGTLGFTEQELSTDDTRTVGEVAAQAVSHAVAALEQLGAAAADLADGVPGADDRYAEALKLALAMDAWDAERRVRPAMEALGAEPDWSRPLSELSVGQRYRVRLACLIGGHDDFLLLDEPTDYLDRAGLDFLTTQLKARNGEVVIVSHDRTLLADVAETLIDLDPTYDDRPRVYGGGYAGYREGHRAELERWEQEYATQQTERSRLQDDLNAAQNRLISGGVRIRAPENTNGPSAQVARCKAYAGVRRSWTPRRWPCPLPRRPCASPS